MNISKHNSVIILAAPLVLLSLIICIITSTKTHASDTMECKAISLVFARGSGQTIDKNEARTFFNRLTSRLSGVGISQYELGSSDKTYGAQYDAIGVDPLNIMLGAWVSAGNGYAYGDSVRDGVTELTNYLSSQSAECPDTQYVLGGYSQGAQVVGQSLPQLSSQIRSKIVFAALFGDPKLHLPEGEGILPPACRGEQISPWRRGVDNCMTHSGILTARTPYLPDDMKNKTGLWCNKIDIICGSNLLWSDHDKYAAENGPIDHAALEIAQRIQKIMIAKNTTTTISVRPKAEHIVIPPDVMILSEAATTITDNEYYNVMIPLSTAIVDSTVANGGRVATNYFDGDSIELTQGEVNVHAQPGEQVDNIMYYINHMRRALPNRNMTESLYKWLYDTELMTNWRHDAYKVIIALTKTPYEVSEIQRLASLAPEFPGSPFKIYMVNINDVSPMALPITPDGPESPIAITDIPSANIRYPQSVAKLSATNYQAPPGTTLTFDASQSFAYDSTVNDYLWDFDGDGFMDERTSDPVVSHTYNWPFDGEMAVQVNPYEGWCDTATAHIFIDESVATVAMVDTLVQKPNVTVTGPNTAQLAWRDSLQPIQSWSIQLNGAPLGTVRPPQHSIEVRDVDTRRQNDFTIIGTIAPSRSNAIVQQPSASIPTSNNQPSSQPTNHPSNQPPTPQQNPTLPIQFISLTITALFLLNYRRFRF